MAKAGAQAKVPVTTVAFEAYRAVFGRLNLFFELAWLPLLITLAATLLPGYLRFYAGFASFPAWPGDEIGFGIDRLIEAVVGVICLNAFAVRWHQSLLLRGNPGRRVFLAAWLRFLLYTLLLYLLSAGFLAGILLAEAANAPPALAPLAGIGVLLLWLLPVRCSLVFPAAACGKPLSLVAAWRGLRGNSWRLLGCGLIACLPPILIAALILSGVFTGFQLDRFGGDLLPPGFFILRGVIETCANYLVMALGAAVLALFYRRTAAVVAAQLGGASAPGAE